MLDLQPLLDKLEGCPSFVKQFTVNLLYGTGCYNTEDEEEPEFAPDQIDDLLFWHDAATGLFQDSAKITPVVADGDPVGAWEDRSVNGLDALQPTAGQRAEYEENIGGFPAVFFEGGTNKHLQVSPGVVPQPYSHFAVVYVNDSGLSKWIFETTSDVYAVVRSDEDVRIRAGATLIVGSADTVPPTITTLVTTVFDGVSSSVRINGVEVAVGNAGGNSLNSLILGSNVAIDRPLAGYIFEDAMYNSLLDPGDLTILEDYFINKYGI